MPFMSEVRQKIEKLLQQGFSPVLLHVEDQSARHAGHAGSREGGETHFDVRIVSAAFKGQGRVERQRAVYDQLKDLMNNPIHALSLQTLTPEEAGTTYFSSGAV